MKPIEKEMAMFNSYFNSQFKSDIPLLDSALKYVSEGAGKKMRPMLLLLVAKCLGDVSTKALAAASAMEMLHTASLLHDDVIDESDKRRGRESLNVVYNNNIAVLVGDYILSQALNNAATARDYKIVEELSILGKALSRGELMQFDIRQKISDRKYHIARRTISMSSSARQPLFLSAVVHVLHTLPMPMMS